MMNNYTLPYILFLGAIMSLSCDSSVDVALESNEDFRYHIIVIAGQSNTHKGSGFDPFLDTAAKNVMQLGRFGANKLKVVQAKEPLDHHTKEEGKIGFGLTFVNLYSLAFTMPKDTVIIVPCGYGGTGFIDNRWNMDDDLYDDVIFRVKYLKENLKNSKVEAILWHQGEKDITNSDYKRSLESFINDIRGDLGEESIPFVLGGMVPYWVDKKYERVRQQDIFKSFADSNKLIGYADPTLPFVLSKDNDEIDAFHFDAKGQRELGKRYFTEFSKLVK